MSLCSIMLHYIALSYITGKIAACEFHVKLDRFTWISRDIFTWISHEICFMWISREIHMRRFCLCIEYFLIVLKHRFNNKTKIKMTSYVLLDVGYSLFRLREPRYHPYNGCHPYPCCWRTSWRPPRTRDTPSSKLRWTRRRTHNRRLIKKNGGQL